MATKREKSSLVLVYTGDGKGKTSAALGLIVRALGAKKRVAFIQFIKNWHVSEHDFLAKIDQIFPDKFYFFKGGKGFFQAGELSAKNSRGGEITMQEHKVAARETFSIAQKCAASGEFDIVICDEINNAVADGLLEKMDLENLVSGRNSRTSLCLTGRNFPAELLNRVDIATEMRKIKHHYDDGFFAEKGIDF